MGREVETDRTGLAYRIVGAEKICSGQAGAPRQLTKVCFTQPDSNSILQTHPEPRLTLCLHPVARSA